MASRCLHSSCIAVWGARWDCSYYAHVHIYICVSCVHSNSFRARLVVNLVCVCAPLFIVRVFMGVDCFAAESAEVVDGGASISIWRLRRKRRAAARTRRMVASDVLRPPPGLEWPATDAGARLLTALTQQSVNRASFSPKAPADAAVALDGF